MGTEDELGMGRGDLEGPGGSWTHSPQALKSEFKIQSHY